MGASLLSSKILGNSPMLPEWINQILLPAQLTEPVHEFISLCVVPE
jgi:hypothetical protein